MGEHGAKCMRFRRGGIRLESLCDCGLGFGILLGVDVMLCKKEVRAHVPRIVLQRIANGFEALLRIAWRKSLGEAEPEVGILRELFNCRRKGLRRESEIVLVERELST